jgi:hypothetical protein
MSKGGGIRFRSPAMNEGHRTGPFLPVLTLRMRGVTEENARQNATFLLKKEQMKSSHQSGQP